ncbi:MAG: phosphoserine phosphatase SerB [Alphaproteobacteria bacterium]|nr:phosphoserine phosphatase SerB [Alphaproteobacteria bacterium]
MTKYSLVLTCAAGATYAAGATSAADATCATGAASEPIITAQLANAIVEIIDGTSPDWLATNSACDIGFGAQNMPMDEAKAKLAQVRKKIGTQKIDANVIETATRRKSLLVADMESTIIEQECLDELADMVGLRPQIADITARAMQGELDFEAALQERVRLLKGLPESALQKIYDERITMTAGAAALVATMRQNGAVCGLVSGGFSFYAEKIATHLGFDHWRSNHLQIKNSQLDGTVAKPILGREDKAACLAEWQKTYQLAQSATMAVGDGANDLAMLAGAGAGVAFHAKPRVAEIADICINHSDLTALLYLQAYRAEQIIQTMP